MTKITLTLLPQKSGTNLVYNYCNISVALSLSKEHFGSKGYSVLLYNEQLMLLACGLTDDMTMKKSGRHLKFSTGKRQIWIPGNYFLLLRNSEGTTWRFNLELNEKGTFRVYPPTLCPKMSDEDMLSCRLLKYKGSWTRLSTMPGTMQLKRWAIERAKQNELNDTRESMHQEKLRLNDYLLISSKIPCYISPSVIMLIRVAEIESERKFGHLGDFYDSTKNNPYEKMNEYFERNDSDEGLFAMIESATKAYTYVYSNLDVLMDTGGKVIMKAIQKHWPSPYGSVIFCGTRQEIGHILTQNPSLKTYFPTENKLSLEPFTREEAIHLFFDKAEIAKLTLSAEAVDKVCRLMSEAYRRGIAGHWDKAFICDYVDRNLMPKYLRSTIEGINGGETVPQEGNEEGTSLEVQSCDIDEDFFLHQRSSYNEALEELQKMVGLTDIKKSIRTLSGQMKFFQERRALGLHCSNDAAYHTILTGNPGTGKTTVARLLGKIYHSLGLLSKGDVIYADRSTIVGRYIGETEENMKLLMKEAQGNVLFIDEAYTLYSPDDSRDFGKHAVECLLEVLSRKDPDMLIVFAGYKKEMDTLLSMNPGLEGRFPNNFHFPNYSAEELMQIAEKILSTDQYELTSEASSLLLQSIREEISRHSEKFSNARWIEQFVKNGIIPALAERVTCLLRPFNKADYQRVEASDVRIAAEKFKPKNIELKRRTAIGFCA